MQVVLLYTVNGQTRERLGRVAMVANLADEFRKVVSFVLSYRKADHAALYAFATGELLASATK